MPGRGPVFHHEPFPAGRETEARHIFDKVVAQMKPLPADENQPLANGAIWLAYKKPKGLLKSDANAAQAKP